MSVHVPRRVVITGIGLVTPLAGNRESTWSRLIAGESGLRWLPPEHLDGLTLPHSLPPGLHAGGPATADNLPSGLHTGEPIVDLALQAASEAVQHANLRPDQIESSRAGVVLGTSKGGLRSFQRFRQQALGSEDHSLDAARHWEHFLSDTPARHVARTFRFHAGALCPVAACATGLLAIDRGGDLIRHGQCDLVLAGSSDASLLPALQGSFQRLGVLARSFTDPATACRPFDKERDGFLIGEGAGVLLLEDREHALRRGAHVLAEWLGGAQLSDATGLTQLEAESPTLVELLQRLPARCGFDWNEVGYLNLHGTGTEMNDACEAAALRLALGQRAGEIPGSSLKGALGHLLGAAGSVEAALTVLALERGQLPSNRNLTEPLSGCRLNLIRETTAASIEVAVKLSLGFGGHLVAGAFRSHSPNE